MTKYLGIQKESLKNPSLFQFVSKTLDEHRLQSKNGSDKIGGSTVNATLDVEGIAVTLVFIDSYGLVAE